MASTPTEHTFPGFAPRVDTVFRASLLQIPLFGDENLLTQGADIHPTVAAQLVVAGRLWSDAERQIKLFREAIDLPVAGATQSKFTVLEKGSLLSLRVSVDTAGIAHGDVWARLVLSKGLTGGLTFPATLVQGYVTNFEDLAWPGSRIESLHDGKGAIRVLAWTAGAQTLTATVPTGRRWRVITGNFDAVMDANPASRVVDFQVQRSGTTLFRSRPSPPQTAGSTGTYTLTPSMAFEPTGGIFMRYVPFVSDLELAAGDQLVITLDGAQAGDAFQGESLIVREWFAP